MHIVEKGDFWYYEHVSEKKVETEPSILAEIVCPKIVIEPVELCGYLHCRLKFKDIRGDDAEITISFFDILCSSPLEIAERLTAEGFIFNRNFLGEIVNYISEDLLSQAIANIRKNKDMK